MLVSLYKVLKASQHVWIIVLYFAANYYYMCVYYIKIKCYELGQRLVLISTLSSSSKIVLHIYIYCYSIWPQRTFIQHTVYYNVGTLVFVYIHVHYYTCTYSASSVIFLLGMQQCISLLLESLFIRTHKSLQFFMNFITILQDGGHLVM